MSLTELFDDLKVSMRHVHYYTGMPEPVVRQFAPKVRIHQQFEGQAGYVAFETPCGNLTERCTHTVDGTWRTTLFAVETVDDLRACAGCINILLTTSRPKTSGKAVILG